VRLTATVSAPSALPGSGAIDGNVTFMDGTTTLGTGAISPSSVATLDLNSLPVGSHSWSASHTGNVNYAISRSTVLPETVQLATTSVQLNSSFTFPIAGSGITLTAIVSGTGSVPTGTVTFYDGNASLGTSTVNGTGQANFSVSTLGAGSHAITASFGGDAKDSGSTSSPLAQLVLQAVTSIALTSSANPSVAGVSLTFIASLTSNGSLPKGQITLKEGSTTLAIGTLGVTGAYSFIVPSLAAGSHAFSVIYAGDADHTASISSLTQLVQQGTSAITVISSQNPSVAGQGLVLSAMVTGSGNQPGGAISFLDGTVSLGVVNLDSSGAASLALSALPIGDHSITVTYAGDTTHTAALPGVLVQRVQQLTTSSLSASANPIIVGAPLQLTATVVGLSGAAATGTVSFTDGPILLGVSRLNPAGVASVSVSSLAAGTHQIIAIYSGDAQSRTSLSSPLSESVNSAGTTIAIASSANPTIVGNAVTLTANVASVGEAPTGKVTFLDGSIPLGAVRSRTALHL